MTAAAKVTKQEAFVVTNGANNRLAFWMEYEVGGRRATTIAIIKPTRTLVPRDGMGFGIETTESNVSRVDVEAWFESCGYRVLRSIDCQCNEPVGYW
ncbi:MAG: hypothetical protein HY901_35095 [Deltaproteobacteria bacterium]|nr:hypothetical protein [Deltaproteobacteria bacterium]